MAIGYLNKGGSAADLDAITATAPDVLLDKVILNKDGDPIKGTMPNNGSWSFSRLKAGATVSVHLGYHNGKGTVTADTLANQTPANANAGQILRGQTAWVNGGLVTGTMNNYSGNTSTSNPVASTFRSATTGYVYASPGGNGYYTTGSYLRIPASNLRADNIKKGVNVMGIIGTLEEFKSPENITLDNPSITYKVGEVSVSNLSTGSSNCYLYVQNSTYQGKQNKILVRLAPLNLTGWNSLRINMSSSNVYSNTSFRVYVGVSTNPNLASFSFNASYVNSYTGNMPNISPMINVASLSGVYYLFCGNEITYGNHNDNYNVRFSEMRLTTQ